MTHEPKTIVFYHGECPDGFGGAYSAWKKLGDSAHYIPLKYGTLIDTDIAGANLYFVDFCYPKPVMDDIVVKAGHVTVLDHHEGTEAVVETMPEYVYDANRSGASIAWSYFHPDTPMPALVKYVEDDDLYRFKLEDTRSVISYLSAHPFSFELWDEVAQKLDAGGESAREMLGTMRTYEEQFDLLCEMSANQAKLVEFEGHEVYFGYTHQAKPMKSKVGNLLAKKKGPFALVVSPHPLGYGVSIRGDGTIDVSAIARKYGGNGHPNSSGFHVENNQPMPWKLVERDIPTD
jgi:oligoribonuclease NrnB/cAMP/cGMP phosphodiesterase (DHH superfamily)